MNVWTYLYPGLSVVFLGSGVRAWGRFARSGQRRWFAVGVVLIAIAFDGLRALSDLLRFRAEQQRWLIWALVAFSAAAVLRQTWTTLAPAPADEEGAESVPDDCTPVG